MLGRADYFPANRCALSLRAIGLEGDGRTGKVHWSHQVGERVRTLGPSRLLSQPPPATVGRQPRLNGTGVWGAEPPESQGVRRAQPPRIAGGAGGRAAPPH